MAYLALYIQLAFVHTVGVSPGAVGVRTRGVLTGSALSPLDGIGAVAKGEAAGAGVAAVDWVSRGRVTRGGELARWADDKGDPLVSKPQISAGGAFTGTSRAILR